MLHGAFIAIIRALWNVQSKDKNSEWDTAKIKYILQIPSLGIYCSFEHSKHFYCCKPCCRFTSLGTLAFTSLFTFVAKYVGGARARMLSAWSQRGWGRQLWLATCVRAVDNTKKSCPVTCKWKKGICRGHSLFSPEAVIYLGQNPTLNRCVCFYGLGGFACAPQPLKAAWGAAGFGPNLGIVKPHRFLTPEEHLASCRELHQTDTCRWDTGCVFVLILLSWVGWGNCWCSHRFSTNNKKKHLSINSWGVWMWTVKWLRVDHFRFFRSLIIFFFFRIDRL